MNNGATVEMGSLIEFKQSQPLVSLIHRFDFATSEEIRKSTIAIPSFYQQKKDSKVLKDEGREPSSKPHRASSSKSGTPTKSLEKVIPIPTPSNISNSAAYPSDRDLEDHPSGFGGQPNTKRNFSHTFYESNVELGKGDVMEDGGGNLEMLPRKGPATSEKPRDEGSKVNSPTQPSATCESPSLNARLLCEVRDSAEILSQASTDERGAHEDTLHSLWSCSGLKEVWEKDFGWIFRSRMVITSLKRLVNLAFTKSELVPLFATTAWSVWFHRNKIRLSENSRPLSQIVGFARDYVHDF
nr:hypothetical protein CFP56_36815 [Quercus suber]